MDATFETRHGKFVNHSSKHPNCVIKQVKVDNDNYLCLFALKDIPSGTELRYHYGVNGLDWQVSYG